MLTQQIKGSKRYKEAASKVDLAQSYSLQDASALLNTLPKAKFDETCLLYTSPSPRDGLLSRMPSSA